MIKLYRDRNSSSIIYLNIYDTEKFLNEICGFYEANNLNPIMRFVL